MPACGQCGADFPVSPGRGRPRRYCEQCSRKPRPKADSEVVVPLQPRREAESLAAQTITELTEAGRNTTARGIRAIKLARLIDAGEYNAQGAAALAKAHHEALELALEGASVTADVIDLVFGHQA